MIDEYFEALKSRLEEHPSLSGKVFDTLRLNPTGGLLRENYILLYSPSPLDIPQTRFSQVQTFADEVDFEVDLRIVAVNTAGVRGLLSRVLTQLVGHRLELSGRQPAKLTLSEASRVREDQSVKDFLYYADVSAEWTSRPA